MDLDRPVSSLCYPWFSSLSLLLFGFVVLGGLGLPVRWFGLERCLSWWSLPNYRKCRMNTFWLERFYLNNPRRPSWPFLDARARCLRLFSTFIVYPRPLYVVTNAALFKLIFGWRNIFNAMIERMPLFEGRSMTSIFMLTKYIWTMTSNKYSILAQARPLGARCFACGIVQWRAHTEDIDGVLFPMTNQIQMGNLHLTFWDDAKLECLRRI